MPEFSKEGADLKRRFLQIYDPWEEEFLGPDGKPRKTPANPQGKGITKGRAHRGLYSLLLSPDDVHLDYIDNRLTKGATVKSMMGGLGGRVQKLTSGATSPYAVSPTDSLHHGNNHSSYGATARIQDQGIMRDWLKISADDGVIYGEGSGNLLGNSQDNRSHVGHRGKPGTRFNPTLTEGPDGITALSSHPRGTTDADVAIPHRVYSSGQEMFDAGAEVRKTNANDVLIGNAADQTRRTSVIQSATEAGIIKPGDNPFSPDAPQSMRTAVKKFLSKDQDAMRRAAQAFNPELARRIAENGGSVNAGLLDSAGNAIKNNWKSELFGTAIGLAADPAQRQNIMDGNVRGLVKHGARDAFIGGVTNNLVKLGISKLPAALAGPAAGVANLAPPVMAGLALGEGLKANKRWRDENKRKEKNLTLYGSNNPTPHQIGQGKTGKAILNGKEITVPYGSVAGQKTQQPATKVNNVIAEAANHLEYAIKNPLSIFGIK